MSCHEFTLLHTEGEDGRKTTKRGVLPSLTLLFPLLLSHLIKLIELTLGHLRYHLTDVPPQPNSPPDYVFRTDQPSGWTTLNPKLT